MMELKRDLVSLFEMKYAPALKQGNDSPHEEQPHSPSGRPETTAWTFANRTCVESIVDQVFEILGQAHLSHQLVLVTVHAGQCTDVRKNVLQGIGQLERVHVTQPELNMRIHDKLGEPKNFTAQMESISEARLLSLFGG